MIFDGTQPVLTQVPPTVPDSMIVTMAPSSAARNAAANEAEPLPMMATFSAGSWAVFGSGALSSSCAW
jgi:hypothetical protein